MTKNVKAVGWEVLKTLIGGFFLGGWLLTFGGILQVAVSPGSSPFSDDFILDKIATVWTGLCVIATGVIIGLCLLALIIYGIYRGCRRLYIEVEERRKP